MPLVAETVPRAGTVPLAEPLSLAEPPLLEPLPLLRAQPAPPGSPAPLAPSAVSTTEPAPLVGDSPSSAETTRGDTTSDTTTTPEAMLAAWSTAVPPAPGEPAAATAPKAPGTGDTRAAPRTPAAMVKLRPLVLLRARGAVWSISVLLVSLVVGLVFTAGISDILSGPAPVSHFQQVASRPPGHFRASAVISHAKLPAGASIDAYIKRNHVALYARPDGHLHHRRLNALTVNGKPLPLVLLVERQRPGWLEVQLPIRPNLSTAWIHSGDAVLHSNLFHVVAQLGQHKLNVWKGTKVIERVPIGVGESVSPTPSGRYYITDLLQPPDPNGLYGPYAFGLSAYSDVYTSFAGGPGQIGLHGTDDPAGLGSNVSHGCIRVSNDTIIQLAKLLPIGTPVVIKR